MSTDIGRPLLAMLNLAAWLERCPVVFFVDIDFRLNAQRRLKLGHWSRRSYWLNKCVHDPFRWVQVWLAVRTFPLLLLKSAALVRDFGQGRPHVKNFYDTVHGPEHLIAPERQAARLASLQDASQPLELVFFGRFVEYKGLDRTIEAVRLARAQGAHVHLTLIGAGECESALRLQVVRDGLTSVVQFHPMVPYGAELFERLHACHVAVATPLTEDTPRAAFDAMACGLPQIAFDIDYYRSLADGSQAVVLAAWPDAQAVADAIVSLSQDRARVARLSQNAVAFAAQNTQAVWLQRRHAWISAIMRPTP